MILLWFILGLSIIFGIARYNESNKLFWTLLFSFVIGFAGTKMVIQTISGEEEQGSVSISTVCPTQLPCVASTINFVESSKMAPVKVTASNAVSQTIQLLQENKAVVLSKVFGKVRDQPQLSLLKPPELCLQKDFLTLHDTG